MRVLVTGDLGFVGSATSPLLDVIGFDLMRGQDIRDPNQLEDLILREKPDRILHLAAVARFAEADADPLLTLRTNVQGTQNVVDVADRHHVPMVYASTGSVYMPITREPPITEEFPAVGNSVYGCTKRMGELAVMGMHTPWIVLRYSHLYGNEKRLHGLVGGLLDRMERGLSPTLYGGGQSNDFMYVEDVARANKAALEAPFDCWRQVYNVGTGEELTTDDAASQVFDVFGYDGDVDRVPQRSVDPARFVYDTSKATRLLGFTAAYSFRAGLEAMRDSRP